MSLIGHHLEELRKLLDSMSYVSEGDMVLAEHMNTVLKFCMIAFDALKILYEDYKTKREKEIDVVNFCIQLSESRLKMLSEVKHGDVVATRDHNVLIDVLKAIQACLLLIGGKPYP